MRPPLLVEVKAIGGLIVGAVIVIYLLGWPERQYDDSFKKIPLGASRDSITDLLGKRTVTSQDCYVAQFIQFENPPGWTQKPTAAYCLEWIGPGVGKFYAVAFDSDNRVLGIAYGDS
jgi:hypothetical protein